MSEIVGFDNHEESINEARRRAADAGLADRVRFQVASAQDFPGSGYDLVCIFDALHDMGDPLGAARHIGQSLADDGTWMLVEPSTAGALEDNVNPVSRIYYSAAVGICTPAAQAQSGGFALGNQVDDDRWSALLGQAGFSRFRRATETPFNRIFEVQSERPKRRSAQRPNRRLWRLTSPEKVILRWYSCTGGAETEASSPRSSTTSQQLTGS